ncbi:MAG: histidinol phosphatase-like enzyme (inositol monophosphatase family) [Paracoccaceae bacterium]|jgi:histidinol phosphatase-like enzyme (inositol monophosphatase family)
MSNLSKSLQTELIATAHALADAARPVTLAHFRDPAIQAENKLQTGFDPVTIADRGAETAMRDVLSKLRPDDGVLGEEFPPIAGTSGFTWVLDPIDGTRSYISGTPTWGILIAVNHGAAPIYGMIDQPYIGERFCGGFGEAYVTGPQGRSELAVRQIDQLKDAILFTTFPEVGTPAEGAAFRAVSEKTKLTRYGLDCYAYGLLAAGQIDLVIESGLNAFDVQGPIAVIEAAGGIVTNWRGGPAYDGGQILAAGTKALHEQAMQLLVG